MNYLHELQYVFTPITRKLINIYFTVIDILYVGTYITFTTIYVVNKPISCGGIAIIWFILTLIIVFFSISILKDTVNCITLLPKIRLYDSKCYIYILMFLYLWSLFNVYINECYFSDNNVNCKDIYDCKDIYLFLVINGNIYFLWINSIIIHLLLCTFYHFRKKKNISNIIEITELGDNTECSICLDSFTNKKAVRTICNHVFHYDCIIEWMSIQQNCPICRLEL